jgi:hypothetical protein
MRPQIENLFRLAATLPQEELPRFLGQLKEAETIASSRLPGRAVPPAPPDSLVGIKEASQRLKLSESYLHRHADGLPFTVRIGRRLLFSSRGIDVYIGRHASLTARQHRTRLEV